MNVSIVSLSGSFIITRYLKGANSHLPAVGLLLRECSRKDELGEKVDINANIPINSYILFFVLTPLAYSVHVVAISVHGKRLL